METTYNDFSNRIKVNTTPSINHLNENDSFLVALRKEYPDYDIKENKKNGEFLLIQLKSENIENTNPVYTISKKELLTPKRKLENITSKQHVKQAHKKYIKTTRVQGDILQYCANLIQQVNQHFSDDTNIQFNNSCRIKSLHSYFNKEYRNRITNKEIMEKSGLDTSKINLPIPPQLKENTVVSLTPEITEKKLFKPVISRDMVGLKLILSSLDENGIKQDNIETQEAIDACNKTASLIETLSQESDGKFTIASKKDMIKYPKLNGYQAIHYIIHYHDNFFEIQIKTGKMERDSKTHPNIAHKTSYKSDEGHLNEHSFARCPAYVEFHEIDGELKPIILSTERSFKRFYNVDLQEFKIQSKAVESIRKKAREFYKEHPEYVKDNNVEKEKTANQYQK